jgi:dihydrodipicolinate synthase/N-acetylneuraminate lyase
MLDKIEFISIGNNPLINNDNFDLEKIKEFFEIKKIEGTKFDLGLFNVDKLEKIPKEKLDKLEGKFIEFYLRANNSKIKLCKNI